MIRQVEQSDGSVMHTGPLDSVSHRPWPVPARRWLMFMRWHDLAFFHWPLAATALRPLIPHPLALDQYEGTAWIGIVPFRMTGIRCRGCPALPGLSAFPELNVRTYVTVEGKPGVWFFSLDAANRLAVWVARAAFHLPYHFARMSVRYRGESVTYVSRRHGRAGIEAKFEAGYQPTSAAGESKAGSIEHWLTERYCLYAADRNGRVFRGDIHHKPWPLQAATGEIGCNTMLAPLGVEQPTGAPLVHFARRLEVVAWRIAPLTAAP